MYHNLIFTHKDGKKFIDGYEITTDIIGSIVHTNKEFKDKITNCKFINLRNYIDENRMDIFILFYALDLNSYKLLVNTYNSFNSNIVESTTYFCEKWKEYSENSLKIGEHITFSELIND